MTASIPLHYQNATDLVRQMQHAEFSVATVLEAHLKQIEKTNPALNAIVTLCEDKARQRAQVLDALPLAERQQMPLFGLPIAHKDLSPTAGVRTTSGSLIFKDHVPKADGLQVTRLREAGAVMLGKTNTPEFGAGSQTFNEVFGATKNPYDTTTTCGGSSGGAAVALASGMLPIADGSDLGGSLRNPAAFCNVVGMRPSWGRVPSFPTADAWNALGTEGPMARSVSDLTRLLSVMAGPDPRVPLSLDADGSMYRDLSLRTDLKGLRVAFAPDFGGQLPITPEIVQTVAALRPTLLDLGAEVVDDCFDFHGAAEAFDTIRAWMFATGVGRLIAGQEDKAKTTVRWNVDRGRALTWEQFQSAQACRSDVFLRLHEYMQGFDALLLPTTQVQPFSVDQEYVTEINGQPMHTYLDWMQSCCLVSITGHPALSLPAGFAGGLPVGLQIVGRHRADAQVLQIAHAIEQATQFAAQRPPNC